MWEGDYMGELIAYGSEVKSIFQLIGTTENDITKSIAWAMCKCSTFTKLIIAEVLGIDINLSKVRIKYQDFEKAKGITDLEITDDEKFYIIIEAKHGWLLPGSEQLTLYSRRKNLLQSNVQYKAIVTMSECSEEYAESYLPFKSINGVPIRHLSWKKIYQIAGESINESSISQKNLLKELMQYLGGIMTMQTKESNWVYVVSIATSKPSDCDLTWIEIVEKRNIYFHPMGMKGWPKEPPNYIAFRYKGQLQSIHHIEDYVVTKNLHTEIEDMPNVEQENDYFVYKLGEAIKPGKKIKTGKIYASGRKWAMFDTLLTADTIWEACEISKKRMQQE